MKFVGIAARSVNACIIEPFRTQNGFGFIKKKKTHYNDYELKVQYNNNQKKCVRQLQNATGVNYCGDV